MESTMVIKVKYGDTLRRFNASVDENEKLVLDIDGLRAKIQSLFNFPQDADLTLTYIDEDGDVVTLVDDDDLCDVMGQRLKFLRIDVQLNDDKFEKVYARSSGSSTPLRSPRVQHPSPAINNKASEILKSLPEPLRETLAKLSIDVATMAASSSPMFADVIDCFSKMGLSHLNVASNSQSGVELSRKAETSEDPKAPSVPKVPNASKDGGLKEVLPKSAVTTVDATSKRNSQEADVGTALRGAGAPVMHFSSTVDLNVVPPIDSVPSGITTVNLAPAACDIPTVDDRTDAKKHDCLLGGKSVNSLASTSSADPTMPSDVNQSITMDLGGNPSNECPFTGIPVANDSPFSYRRPHIGVIQQRINHDAMVGMFHRGVRCDGCGAHPIIGPRFKSKVKDDYDLCSICFSSTGNETDYIRIDRPVHHRHPRSFRGFYDPRPNFRRGAPVPPRISSAVMRGCGIKPGRSNKLDSCFILDVNVFDGTIMAPSTPFTKIWRMRNSGTLVWPRGTKLVWIGGDKFSDTVTVEIEVPTDGVPVEGELDIVVDFTAPELPGRYVSYWRMASPSGVKFGQRVWVLIQVDASMKDSVCDSFGGLNLNFPPESNKSNSSLQIIDMNIQPSADVSFQDPCNTQSVNEPVKPVVNEQPKMEPEMNFPSDGLLIGRGASPSAPPPLPPSQTPPTVSYPIIDLSEAASDESSHAPLPFTGMPTSSEEISDKDTVELTLLKELEEMGFKQVDLNKEILRMNEYDLEQSLDDLCCVTDWDPILEELQEMGFSDEETNKRLLQKNNGSIKRVVMDLLTGEKS